MLIVVTKLIFQRYLNICNKNGIYAYLGVFETEDEAFEVYKNTKENWIKELVEEWKILIEEDVYKALYNYKL